MCSVLSFAKTETITWKCFLLFQFSLSLFGRTKGHSWENHDTAVHCDLFFFLLQLSFQCLTLCCPVESKIISILTSWLLAIFIIILGLNHLGQHLHHGSARQLLPLPEGKIFFILTNMIILITIIMVISIITIFMLITTTDLQRAKSYPSWPTRHLERAYCDFGDHHDYFDRLPDHHCGHLEPDHHSSLDASLARGQTTAAAWMWYTEAVNMNTLSSLSWTNLNTLKYFTLYGTKMQLRNLHLLREQSTGELRTILYHWKAFSIIFLIQSCLIAM